MLGRRLQRKDVAPRQPRAQIVAQRQVHRWHPPGSKPLHAGFGRQHEQREGGLLTRRIELIAAVDGHHRPARLQPPRRRVVGIEAADLFPALLTLLQQRMQQVALACCRSSS